MAQWEKWFNVFVIEDIRKCLDLETHNQPSLQIGLIILSLIGTEALSGYFAGQPADRTTFVPFVKQYFPRAYSPYAEQIYASLRNGLAHDYVIKDIQIGTQAVSPFLLNGKENEPHLREVSPPAPFPVTFNRIAIAKDFLAAWKRYLSDLYSDPILLQKLVNRVNQKGFMMVGQFP